jgi:hypothetical protein
MLGHSAGSLTTAAVKLQQTFSEINVAVCAAK